MTPPEPRQSFEPVWKALELPEAAATLGFGETMTPETWATLASEGATPSGPGASLTPAPSPSLGTARHQATLAAMLADPSPLLAQLPSLDLSLEDDAPGELSAVGVLGEGGMGRVWLAMQRSMRRDLAVKTLKGDVVHEGALRALLSEGLLTGQLEHPGIIPVHQLGRDKRGLPALVMKRIVGVSWSRLLREGAHPALARFGRGLEDPLDAHVEILTRVCDALEYAHRHHVVHRDLKPENVMVGDYGEVYVVDWGIAAMVSPEARQGEREREPLVGTPAYLAPEMVAGEKPDARTDVYLLGAVLHEVLTGRPRHAGASLFEVLAAAFESAPARFGPEVPAELGALCNRATARERAERPASAQAFREALAAWRRHRGSYELAREASGRLAELEGEVSAEPVSFARVASECRFGFLQALREWEGNAEARAGLQRCLRAMLRHALAHEDLGNARALLAELEGDAAEEKSKVEALAGTLRERGEKARRAEAHEHEMDLSVASRQRQALFVGLAVLVLALGAGVMLARGDVGASNIPPRAMLGLNVVTGLVVGAVVYRWRHFFLANQVNRLIVTTVGVSIVGIAANRLHGVYTQRSGAEILASDLVLLSVVTLFGGATSMRAMYGISATCALAAILATLAPSWAGLAFLSGPVLGFAQVAVLLSGKRVEKRA